MPARISSRQVWEEIGKQIFAVLGVVSPAGEARTSGIVYAVHEGRIYIAVGRDSWKARHVARNPAVSLTVTLPRRIPFVPWIKIPPATVTLHGDAAIRVPQETPPAVVRALTRGLEMDPSAREGVCIVEVTPRGEFVTYGVGVSLLTMRRPEAARGRAPVTGER